MALTAPRPEDWRTQQAIVLMSADQAVIRLLKRAQRDINAQLREVRARPAGVGRDVREAQLNLIRANLSRELGKTWRELGNLVEARRAEAASRAINHQQQLDVFTLLLHGVPGGTSVAENIARTEAAQSAQGLDRMMARVSGASYVPLSRRVYNSNVAINSQVDRMVNSALARGLSADEFARELEPFINPNTPGGMRYAALRLARTEINNAAHAQAVSSVQNHPWVKRMKWHLSGSHKPDPKHICDRLAVGGPSAYGTYPKESVPAKPHPHCFCYVTAVTEDDDDDEAFLNALTAGFIEENRTPTNPTGAPVAAAPPPPPESPARPVRPTPVGRAAPVRARPVSQTPPPPPGVAPATPVPAPNLPAMTPAISALARNLIADGTALPAARRALVQRGVPGAQAEEILRELSKLDPGSLIARQTRLSSPRPPMPSGPRVTPVRPAVSPPPSAVRRPSGQLPSDLTSRQRAELRRVNQLEGQDAEFIQQELEFQATILPGVARQLRSVQYHATGQITDYRANSPRQGREINILGLYAQHDRTIYLARRLFERDAETHRAYSEDINYKTRCGHDHTSAQATFAHEFGHHADAVFRRSPEAARQEVWSAVATEMGVDPPKDTGVLALREWVETNRQVVERRISKYASTNEKELIAEIWVEYSTNPNARPEIKRIGEIFKRVIIEGNKKLQ